MLIELIGNIVSEGAKWQKSRRLQYNSKSRLK
jgi:hypothetical protein